MHVENRTLFAAAVALAMVAAACGGSTGTGVESTTAAATSSGAKLSKHDRELLAHAVADGKKSIGVMFAIDPRSTPSVARALQSLGAKIRFRDDDVGYIRAVVATDRVERAAAIAGVKAASVDEVIPLDLPKPEAVDDQLQVDPPGPTTPALNPYMPTRDIGAPQFVAAHPTWDGRGAVIAIVDTGIDVWAPELATAKDLAGNTVPKFANWVSFTDPLTDGDPAWVDMSTQVDVAGGAFTAAGMSYTGVPLADGRYRFGVFDEANPAFANSEYAIGCGGDLNRNGVCGEKFGVLWDTATNRVWVDTDADRSFGDEMAMRDYAVARDVNAFGTDDPATPVRDSVPFVIQTNGKDKFVNIGVVAGSHGTHVAGIAAGKDFFGGAFDGAAPEAQIVSIRACLFTGGCTAHALIEGMIFAAKQSGADVVNMSIGGLPALNDGNNARALLYNQLIAQYGAQIFLSAGNSGPGMNTIGDPAVATDAVAVGAYVTKETWLSNYGAVATRDEGLFPFSSRGPAENGGFKPNIVATGAAVSCIPAWQTDPPLAYQLPPGYGMFNGTSMAAPQAAGGAALLISAAKQTGVQHQPEQLREAIASSARAVPGVAAHEQGAGLFQVGAAWDLLATNLKVQQIVSTAPVSTIISQYLAVPHQGVGIYEREGWTAGQSGTRTITFTRTRGGAKPVSYALSWKGNDGTFSAPSTVALPLNQPVAISIGVAPAADGVHGAILQLDDASTPGIEYQVLNTIVAAGQFSPDNGFAVSYAGSADRPDKTSFYFFVPANTPAFKVDVTGVSGRVRLLRFHPYGVPYDNPNTTGYQTGGTQSRTVANPTPGVWEVTVDTSRTSAVAPATFTVTGSILGVDVTPSSWVIDPAAVGTPYAQTFTFTNRFGPFTGGAAGTALGNAYAARPSIASAGPQQQFLITVPSGTTSITVRIGNASDPAADLDLFLFDCHTEPCVQRAASTSSTANESVTVASPAAGIWIALVDPYAVPAGTTAYDYLDLLAGPGYGAISATDPAALHAHDAVWTAPASVTATAAPTAGRFLQGFLQVKSGSVVLGSAEVDLKNVAP